MRFSFSWLKEYLDTDASPQQIFDALNSLGLEVEEFKETKDPIYAIGLTPNLAHCFSVFGIARELLSLISGTLKPPPSLAFDSQKNSIALSTQYCKGFAYLLTSYTQAPSPSWMIERLEIAGIQSKNLAVDITNYVLLELGHPLHAYDASTVDCNHLEIRQAHSSEKLHLLNDTVIALDSEDLVITSQGSPIALAGVMGGLKTQVTEHTSSLLFEAALFDPIAIRKTAKRHHLLTDASKRFEKGVDPQGMAPAVFRAQQLLQTLSKSHQTHFYLQSESFQSKKISLSLVKINLVLGTLLSMSEVESFLQKLGFSVDSDDEMITVTVPSFRQDINIDVDLIEEVGRVYGYDAIFDNPKPVMYRTSSFPSHPRFEMIQQVRSFLLTQGLQEWVSCDLISPKLENLVAHDQLSKTQIHVQNPCSIDHSVLRTSLLPNFLEIAHRNVNHNCFSIAGFEIGLVHFKDGEQYKETLVASILMMGSTTPSSWNQRTHEYDFFDLKGLIENFITHFKLPFFPFERSDFDCFHPGQQARFHYNQEEIGVLGQLHPSIAGQFDLKHPLFFAEFNLDSLAPLMTPFVKMTPLPLYPGTHRDWTVTLPKNLPYQKILEACQINLPELKSIALLDVYLDEKLGSDQKNVTMRFEYRDPNTTLSLKEIDKLHDQVISNAQKTLDNLL